MRYSATHKTTHNKIHRLDALDAYNQKLVKKIAVRGISMKGLAGSSAYLYLESIEISKQAPVARIEMEIKQTGGEIKRKVMRLSKGQNLYDLSNKLDQYQDFVISQIDANQDTVEFTNGHVLAAGEATEAHKASIHSSVKYDLLGKIAENVQLTRKTVAEIFKGMETAIFGQFKQNPEHFIAEASRLIKEQKATIIIERLSYDEVAGSHDVSIFTAGQSKQDFTKATDKLKNHIYDYVITDSKVERDFVKELDTSAEVTVYAKLPRGFLIPTPVGDYNPDWAISFKEGSVKYIYFVAETKGSMSSMELREIEKTKIECARKFFDKINQRITEDKIKYDVIDSYGRLMDVVGVKAA